MEQTLNEGTMRPSVPKREKGEMEEVGALQELKKQLLQCSKDAQTAVGPTLHLPAVKHMLLACMKDTSKSLEEWIWEPRCQQLLATVKANGEHMDQQVFNNSYKNQILQSNSAVNDETSDEEEETFDAEYRMLLHVEIMKNEAKRKFQNKNFYGAMKGYLKTAELLKPRLAILQQGREQQQQGQEQQESSTTAQSNGNEEGLEGGQQTMNGGYDDGDQMDTIPIAEKKGKQDITGKENNQEEIAEQKDRENGENEEQEKGTDWFYEDDESEEDAEYFIQKITIEATICYNNAAVAGFKAKEYAEVTKACTEALEINPTNPKALYWRARVRIQLKLYEQALQDLQMALKHDPDNKDIKNYCLRVEKTVKECQEEWKEIEAASRKAGDQARRAEEEANAKQDLKVMENQMKACPLSEAEKHGAYWPKDEDPEAWKTADWPKETEDPDAIARGRGEYVPQPTDPADLAPLPPAKGGVEWGPEPKEKPRWMNYTSEPPPLSSSERKPCFKCGSKEHLQRRCPLIFTQLQDPESDWKMPEPPNLLNEYRKGAQYTPAMIFSNYQDRLPVQASFDSKVIEANKRYRARIVLEGRIDVAAEGTSSVKAKQEACFLFFEECYRIFEEQNPNSPSLDRSGLVRPEPHMFPSAIEDPNLRKLKQQEQQNHEWFFGIVTAWIEAFAKMTAEECDELRFCTDLTKKQRSKVHRLAEDRKLGSFSYGEKQERAITLTRGSATRIPHDNKVRYIEVPPLYLNLTPQRYGIENCIKEEEIRKI
mmetsp:Transcript_16172/g.21407  ORF Transcript_16172/g.21407 Transcript_16172/m.21407 type:complete len:768 (+) Transcript_16172:231-2534(+)